MGMLWTGQGTADRIVPVFRRLEGDTLDLCLPYRDRFDERKKMLCKKDCAKENILATFYVSPWNWGKYSLYDEWINYPPMNILCVTISNLTRSDSGRYLLSYNANNKGHSGFMLQVASDPMPPDCTTEIVTELGALHRSEPAEPAGTPGLLLPVLIVILILMLVLFIAAAVILKIYFKRVTAQNSQASSATVQTTTRSGEGPTLEHSYENVGQNTYENTTQYHTLSVQNREPPYSDLYRTQGTARTARP
ncbi:hypothetical protein WMY93_016251 [Mugilogobius chulae]|uniref:Uncharacterized protein n=1 Tax=Mugilogobius chulae TaxID=88201 RepID=A0AAW0NSI4_9GOBI